MVGRGFIPRKHWIWSDMYARQFKSRIPWYFVSRYLEITGVVVACGHFLALVMERASMIEQELY